MSAPRRTFALVALPGEFAVCRLEPVAAIPDWAWAGGFASVTRTDDELSLICAQEGVPADTRCDRGWRCLRVEGPFDLAQTGVLAALAVPLAEAGISTLAVATYDTDYLLVRGRDLEAARAALAAAGHRYSTSAEP
jgi:hypothetical protein